MIVWYIAYIGTAAGRDAIIGQERGNGQLMLERENERGYPELKSATVS